jgi:hypothetical protein
MYSSVWSFKDATTKQRSRSDAQGVSQKHQTGVVDVYARYVTLAALFYLPDADAVEAASCVTLSTVDRSARKEEEMR